MAGCVLYILKGNARFPGASDESHPQRVRANLTRSIKSSPSSEPTNHLPGLGLAHPLAGLGDEHRARSPTGEVVVESPGDWRREDRPVTAAALALEAQDSMAPVVGQVLDVSADGFVD